MKKKIVAGNINVGGVQKKLYSEVDSVCATNTLVTGMTRSGKSYKMRTMAEALCKEMPVWIVDVEDEFYTLREKYPFLYFGEGGEAPMSVDTARAFARKMLEWKVSAVFSLASLKEVDQHLWVFNFIDELMNRPRAEWTRAAIMLDEAHLFAPNSGHGTTEALLATRNLARRGLKRGLVPIWATQRLASLAVAVSSSAENLLVGRTTRSADQEQAAKLLGVSPKQRPELEKQLRRCTKGTFFAVGPAYSEDIIALQTPLAHTTHFSGKIGQEPALPKTPHKLKQYVSLAKEVVEQVAADIKEEESLKDQVKRLEKALKDGGVIEKGISEEEAQQFTAKIEVLQTEKTAITAERDALAHGIGELKRMAENQITAAYEILSGTHASATAVANTTDSEPVATGLTKREASILRGLLDAESIGLKMVDRPWLGVMAGLTANSGQFKTEMGSLSKRGLIEFPLDHHVSISSKGRVYVVAPATPFTHDELMHRAKKSVGDDAYAIAEYVVNKRGVWVQRDELAKKTGYSDGSSKFPTLITKLREAGILEYGPEKTVRATDRILMKQ